MRAHNFFFLFGQGVKNVVSNKLMSLASIGVLIACFLLIGSAVLFTLDINQVAGYIGDQNEVVVYLNEGVTAEEIDTIDADIRSIVSNIAELRFYTKADNLVRLGERLGEDPADLLADPTQDNPLLDSYELRLSDPSTFAEAITLLEGIDGVMRVEGSTEVAQTLVAIKQSVFYGGASIVAILVLVSIVIITNTIKLTVYERRREITIMQYVGAKDGFIRFPFLVEGLLIGLTAATVSFLLLGLGYTYLMQWLWDNYSTDFIMGFFLSNAIEFRSIALYMFGGFAGLGCFLGMSASSVFVRRYLRV